MRDVVILGSTGSIGVQALEVIANNQKLFNVIAISCAGTNPELVIAQAKKFKVTHVGVLRNADVIVQALPGVNVIDGVNASTEIAAINCDVVVNGITGSIGLGPTLAALDAGNTLALANKESLVAGGDLVMSRAREHQIIPVDSEHSAIFQSCLAGKKSEINKIILTASGGAFKDRTNLDGITVEDALKHPTWTMGAVVTINSATLVNKGLEIIEAHHLFALPYSKIEAVIHPQSVVHSLVEFSDGSTIAQASPPNMMGAIAYAMNWPDRLADATAPIDWSIPHSWSFAPINAAQFPSIELARHCGEIGGGLPAIFNAANESAVAAFISKKVAFKSIIGVIAAVVADLEKDCPKTLRDLADVSAIEDDARTRAQAHLLRLAP
ncbi:MAG: 1-deoxy-D-xylulose-5-phosphate reductoisomerase [Actinobacteria bacterium]|uniref:1-deoxy-D-xylulose-5-phosphate reductoisomerase n=1 Tax=freshwater metagenome TaxID=449393 RepID=A0A6J7W6K1_9ZZZZ|nr:1-deoxy-D-xylulose-5-phosphate reductoisomerase [Actinomycetota bacterium]MSX72404.1 1-deoxy-D-xylulose-5-phosphate reductoisomerase [Actinomycetota bacterium]MSY70115.1 1-deoxy-D-xylulose-5-phosphate reductoisomerase [Actinomycetota bacterium]MTA76405.1 1-deoxy-D-xylulose-5-phosphate reductoisomerase [Actinomycetota bacterium]